MTIENPYASLNASRLRIKAHSHEHITSQERLESCLNRGIEVLCAVNYQPSAPSVPISGWSATYLDFVSTTDLTIAPRTFTGGFSNFVNNKGQYVDLDSLVQLPNCEKAYVIGSPLHANFIGSWWADPGISALPGLAPGDHPSVFRGPNRLHTWADMFHNIRRNLQFEGKCFGTINHPEQSLAEIEAYVRGAGDLCKGVEIFSQFFSKSMQEHFRYEIYDMLLMRGYKLWGVSVVDWAGTRDPESGVNHDRGCNVLLIDPSYSSKNLTAKAEMALDAYIDGSFYGSGLGTFDLVSADVNNNIVSVVFSENVDKIVIDIDGRLQTVINTNTASANLIERNTFVRFEAYKGDDFIYTNPFFVKKKSSGRRKMYALWD